MGSHVTRETDESYNRGGTYARSGVTYEGETFPRPVSSLARTSPRISKKDKEKEKSPRTRRKIGRHPLGEVHLGVSYCATPWIDVSHGPAIFAETVRACQILPATSAATIDVLALTWVNHKTALDPPRRNLFRLEKREILRDTARITAAA